MPDTVNWPAIIVFSGDDELLFIENAQAMMENPDMVATGYHPEDQLIDSQGTVFAIEDKNNTVLLFATGQKVTVSHIDALVRRHLSNHGQVCVSKFTRDSIMQAFEIVKASL